MTLYAGLLYSIIIPGGRLVMRDLLDLAGEIGLSEATTMLSTGNMIFRARKTSVAALERRIETAFARRFGKHIDIIVRDAAHWHETARANPFADADPRQVAVRLQRVPLAPAITDELGRYLSEGDAIAVAGGDLWMRFAGPQAESRLGGALTPKRLGIGTSRAVNTVNRLDALLRRIEDEGAASRPS